MKNGKKAPAGNAASGKRTAAKSKSDRLAKAAPFVHQESQEIQSFDELVPMPIGLPDKARKSSVKLLNQILADTITLRDLYKKHHWQVAGATFYPLHLLFDKHAGEQSELVDMLAERIQLLGGISVAMAADVAEMTSIDRPPRGREDVPVQLSRLLEAHEVVISAARAGASAADESDDQVTNDMLVSNVLRTNELQVWFVAEHLVARPLVVASDG